MAGPVQGIGAYVNTTQVWDVSPIYSDPLISENLKELLVRMYQQINSIALVTNVKDSAIYDNVLPFVNSQLFFPNPSISSQSNPPQRGVTRFVVNFGALPNTATKSVAHGLTITTDVTFTRIYGCASDTTGLTYIPLPYASPTLVNNIELNVDATNVNITTGSNRTNYNICYVIMEYLTT